MTIEEKLIREMMEVEQSMYCQECGAVWQDCYDCPENLSLICKICYGGGGFFIHHELCKIDIDEEPYHENFY